MELSLNEANFNETVLSSDKPVLVDFFAEWCGPCRMIAPFVEEIAEEKADTLVVGKLDVDASPSLAVRYGVQSIPTLLLFKNGEVADKRIGYQTKDQLETFVK